MKSVRDLFNKKDNKPLSYSSENVYETKGLNSNGDTINSFTINLDDEKNKDFNDKFNNMEGFPPTYYVYGDQNERIGQDIIIKMISTLPLFRSYLINNYDIDKNFKYYFLTQEEFIDMIENDATLDKEAVKFINIRLNKKLDPLMVYYNNLEQKEGKRSDKKKKLIKKREEYQNILKKQSESSMRQRQIDDLEYDSKPKKSFFSRFQMKDNVPSTPIFMGLSFRSIIILCLVMVVIVLLINVSGKWCGSYGTRLAEFLIKIVILLGSYKLVSMYLKATENNSQEIDSIKRSKKNIIDDEDIIEEEYDNKKQQLRPSMNNKNPNLASNKISLDPIRRRALPLQTSTRALPSQTGTKDLSSSSKRDLLTRESSRRQAMSFSTRNPSLRKSRSESMSRNSPKVSDLNIEEEL